MVIARWPILQTFPRIQSSPFFGPTVFPVSKKARAKQRVEMNVGGSEMAKQTPNVMSVAFKRLNGPEPSRMILKSRRVLVIDDSPTVRELMRGYLSEAGQGIEVLEAEDGSIGLITLGTVNDIDIVFLDVHMPKIGGLEFLKIYRQKVESGEMKDVPIVMVTSVNTMETVTEAKKSGIKGWIIKPFKKESIVATVLKFVSK